MQFYGILGGTFDPIHNGHLHIAQQLIHLFSFDQLRFIPVLNPPHRKPTAASAIDRLAMVKLAINNQPKYIADDREIQRQGISYMVDTLQDLRQEFSSAVLTLILGIDAFQYFDQWHRWQKIISLAHIIVVDRPHYQFKPSTALAEFIKTHQTNNADELKTTAAGKILFVEINPLPVSATQIRSLIAENKDISNLVPAKLLAYMKEHNLYK